MAQAGTKRALIIGSIVMGAITIAGIRHHLYDGQSSKYDQKGYYKLGSKDKSVDPEHSVKVKPKPKDPSLSRGVRLKPGSLAVETVPVAESWLGRSAGKG